MQLNSLEIETLFRCTARTARRRQQQKIANEERSLQMHRIYSYAKNAHICCMQTLWTRTWSRRRRNQHTNTKIYLAHTRTLKRNASNDSMFEMKSRIGIRKCQIEWKRRLGDRERRMQGRWRQKMQSHELNTNEITWMLRRSLCLSVAGGRCVLEPRKHISMFVNRPQPFRL